MRFSWAAAKRPVNAYFRSAEQPGVKIRYNAQVTHIELKGGEFVAAYIGEREVDGQRFPAERIQAIPAFWQLADSNPTANGSVKPGVKTSVKNGLQTTF